ncbi:hypothetical protein ACIGNX_02905 [Actinosynnema sp. NPDC053489]|uniref:hypothetical protein n=1 Tax=Actinosynnema sp. NPDC053489 TaxID=3363916 RepID=UPI0037C5CED5
MRRRLTALLSTVALAALPAALITGTTTAHAADEPTVVCEDANNVIEADFTTNTAQVKTSIYHGCVAVDAPTIVYGRVQPTSGTATGSQSNASITVPDWTIRYYDASDNWIATTHVDITATYLGPLANVMTATTLSTNSVVQVTAGTASRACPTPTHCTYYNSSWAASYPYYPY